jgi:hypothetical protein
MVVQDTTQQKSYERFWWLGLVSCNTPSDNRTSETRVSCVQSAGTPYVSTPALLCDQPGQLLLLLLLRLLLVVVLLAVVNQLQH